MSVKKFSKKELLRRKNEIIDRCLVEPSEVFKISDHRAYWDELMEEDQRSDKEIKKFAKQILERNIDALTEAQELFYASSKYSLLLVFQAMDAAGKDGTIKHVMSGVNPQGCNVSSFKKPSSKELSHNWLWRYTREMPARGMIGIFNRSYYEEVLVLKVHPEYLGKHYEDDDVEDPAFWEQRYEDINNMEKHLVQSNTVILKFFLNVSKAEQRQRFIDRLENSDKNWKFSDSDLSERALWDDYMDAFEKAINATSTDHAPWFVIPADNKWGMRSIISVIITETINSLDMEYPVTTKERKERLNEALEQLKTEVD
ncbi:MAG: PPK2 family polyphosphate kinase [Flavobacteriaceae bacterium]